MLRFKFRTKPSLTIPSEIHQPLKPRGETVTSCVKAHNSAIVQCCCTIAYVKRIGRNLSKLPASGLILKTPLKTSGDSSM
ncbi:hypothetical protein F2P81_018480 [Scophthalmus maximus]|uniref:Uncharacterized protein n=1 Tax=Scophthalmus maximus TaxID=52904 RepID=A0A6A4SAH5_SCOMX|nr:hypothetical protein F2P81_018480 [Scophthalmus maximus]